VWGLDGDGNSDTIMEYICKMRAKFEVFSLHGYIETVWGVGYKISARFLCVGLLLSAISFMACVELRNRVESYPQYEITVDEKGEIDSSYYNGTTQENNRNEKYFLIDILFFCSSVIGIGRYYLLSYQVEKAYCYLAKQCRGDTKTRFGF